MNDKTVIGFDNEMKNYADRGRCYPDNTLATPPLDLRNSSSYK